MMSKRTDYSVLRFLRGEPDAHPKRLRVEWIIDTAPDQWLQASTDWLGWCFPTLDGVSPRLTEAQADELSLDYDARQTMIRLRQRFELYLETQTGWRTASHRDHQRITQVLASTRLFFGSGTADALRKWVLAVAKEPEPYLLPNSTVRLRWKRLCQP